MPVSDSTRKPPFIGGVEGLTFAGKKYLEVGGAIDMLQRCVDGQISIDAYLAELRRVFDK